MDIMRREVNMSVNEIQEQVTEEWRLGENTNRTNTECF